MTVELTPANVRRACVRYLRDSLVFDEYTYCITRSGKLLAKEDAEKRQSKTSSKQWHVLGEAIEIAQRQLDKEASE